MEDERGDFLIRLDTANTVLINGLVLILEQKGLLKKDEVIAMLKAYAEDLNLSEKASEAVAAKLSLLAASEL